MAITTVPELTLVKHDTLDMTVVAPGSRADVGDRVDYTLTATNAGNVTLTGVTISDPKLGTLTCVPAPPATLQPGEQLICTGSYTLTQADLDSGRVANTATADSGQTAPIDTPNDVCDHEGPGADAGQGRRRSTRRWSRRARKPTRATGSTTRSSRRTPATSRSPA